MLGIVKIQAQKPIPSGRKSRINGDCMICTATSGNGVKTHGMKTTKEHQMTENLGYKGEKTLEFCAVVAGTTIRGAVVHPIGLGEILSHGTTTTVFAWPFLLSRLLVRVPPFLRGARGDQTFFKSS